MVRIVDKIAEYGIWKRDRVTGTGDGEDLWQEAAGERRLAGITRVEYPAI